MIVRPLWYRLLCGIGLMAVSGILTYALLWELSS